MTFDYKKCFNPSGSQTCEKTSKYYYLFTSMEEMLPYGLCHTCFLISKDLKGSHFNKRNVSSKKQLEDYFKAQILK